MSCGKIITVWGSPCSGKTTFATKLASAIYNCYESTVIVMYCDIETPVLPYLFPFCKTEELGSVGIALSKTQLETCDIINSLVTVKSMQNFGFLGYKTGENRYSYPRYGKAKAEELLQKLRSLSDYIIVDCSSDLSDSILSQSAITASDQIIRLYSPDLKSLSFYLSQLSVYSDVQYRTEEHICGINTPNADVFIPIEEAKAQFGEISFTLPFSFEVKEQMQQGKLFEKTSDKHFETRINEIASKVVAYGSD